MNEKPGAEAQRRPVLRWAGFDGLLVSFADSLSEPANRAALAFRAAVNNADWPGVEETSTSLVSTYIRFDPLAIAHDVIKSQTENLLSSQNWMDAALPDGRTLWHIPTVFEPELAPQLTEAAAMAGLTAEAAVNSILDTQVRVQTIGFAPGQPYLGQLADCWDIPRQTTLTDRVPIGALTVAIRQLVLFSVSAPTGWRHIGQTTFRGYRPDRDQPFVLRPGDEVRFERISSERYQELDSTPDGGAYAEPLS